MSPGLLIADIHGNLEALEAVFETCPPDEFDFILNAGDSLTCGPDPAAVVDLLELYGVTSIRGMMDKQVLKAIAVYTAVSPEQSNQLWLYNYAAQQLTADQVSIVKGWPEELRLRLDDQTLHLVHGSPADFKETLSSMTSDARLAELARLSNSDLVVCGHSQAAFARQIQQTLFINPGMVGQPFNGGHQAGCAVLEIDADDFSVDLLQVNYGWRAVLKKMQAGGFPTAITKAFEIGGLKKMVNDE